MRHISEYAAQVVLDLGDDPRKQRSSRSRKMANEWAQAIKDGNMARADEVAAEMRLNSLERAAA